jgi:hypothetical protein
MLVFKVEQNSAWGENLRKYFQISYKIIINNLFLEKFLKS